MAGSFLCLFQLAFCGGMCIVNGPGQTLEVQPFWSAVSLQTYGGSWCVAHLAAAVGARRGGILGAALRARGEHRRLVALPTVEQCRAMHG